MTRNLLRAGALSCALLTSTALTAPAMAQQQASIYQHVDGNGVDLVDGSFNFSILEGSIGSGEGAISLVRTHGLAGPGDNMAPQFRRTVTSGQARIDITFGTRRETFSGTSTANSFTADQAEGVTLTRSAPGLYTYTAADGTATTFAAPSGLTLATDSPYCHTNNQALCVLIPTQTVRPNGHATSFTHDIGENCQQTGTGGNGDPIYSCAQFWRLRAVGNSFGFRVSFAFATEANPTSGLPSANWHRRTSATLSNTAISGAPTRTVSYAAPSSSVTEITTDGGHLWRLTRDGNGRLSGIRRPGASSDTTTIAYSGSSLVVSSVTTDGATTSYSRSVSGSTATMTVTNALSQVSTIVSNLTTGRPTSVANPLGDTTSYGYDSNGRLLNISAPEGNLVSFVYDGRGNVTQTRRWAKAGSGLAIIDTFASFPSTCDNPVTCNQPTSTTDARGNVTDYEYDATHGGVTRITAPAATSGGVRPQLRNIYALTNGEYQLTATAACQTQAGASGSTPAACAGGTDETVAEFAYDANGNVTSVMRRNGNSTLSATEARTYDSAGNLTSVDGPLSGAADTTRMRYNASRQVVGVISPDPDGSGPLQHRAVRTTYDVATGLPTRVERGTVSGTSDVAWAAFAPLEAQAVEYDTHQRPFVQRLMNGSTTYALTQTGYDQLGRPICVAQRMNSAEFATASLPVDGCTLDSVGSHGPDRITRTSFDAAGRVSLVQTGYGVTGVQADEVATTYTANGQVESVTDAEGNRTTYVYDGFDRLSRTRYPSPTTDGVSSTTDYEELGYDAAGNITSRRNRANETASFTYDNLNRMTLRNLPGTEPDVSYGYDLLGRMTSASQTGHALSFTYDGLGRRLTETGPLGTTTSTWDVAGRRTRLDYPSGTFYVTYDYNVVGEMTHVRENGALSGLGVLATYVYDNLGRRVSLTRGNGAVTNYGYDPVSRLASLAHDAAGTANDVTTTFTHSPAGQIASAARSNDAYAYGAFANQNVTAGVNGLNQLTTLGSAILTHDARGNLTSDPGSGPGQASRSYTFTSENLLARGTSGSATITFGYDPLTRMYQTNSPTFPTQWAYDGHELIEEQSLATNSRILRYVHGASVDEPLINYQVHTGTGAIVGRRWMHADERGSIIGYSDDTGAIVRINTFDDDGVMGNNWGRFQYTGQPLIVDIDNYYYRARVYAPRMARFLQTDPIGYEDGMNIYAYVGGDPINLTDPSGLCTASRIAYRCKAQNAQGSIAAGLSGYSSAGWQSDYRDDAYLTNVKYHYEEGTYVGGPRDGQIAYRIPTGITATYSASFGDFSFFIGSSLSSNNPYIRHQTTGDGTFGASSTWWSRFDAVDGGRLRDTIALFMQGVVLGLVSADRTTVPGSNLGLPGGNRAFYQRYEVPIPAIPGVISGPRVAWNPDNRGIVYFGPFHGTARPEVPDGWIRFVVEFNSGRR